MKKIRLIEVALLICSAINGAVYYYTPMGINIMLMTIVLAVCILLLFLHWSITKNWEKPKDPWTSEMTWFKVSAWLAAFVLVLFISIALIYSKSSEISCNVSGYIVAATTWLITSVVGAITERKYTCAL